LWSAIRCDAVKCERHRRSYFTDPTLPSLPLGVSAGKPGIPPPSATFHFGEVRRGKLTILRSLLQNDQSSPPKLLTIFFVQIFSLNEFLSISQKILSVFYL